MNIRLTSAVLLNLVALSAGAATPLVDSSGSMIHRQIPDVSTSSGIVGIITSPGTPSPTGSVAADSTDFLSWTDQNQLSCRGSNAAASSAGERLSLCTTSIVAGAIVVEGITEGDLEMGLRHSRHARTLTALFRTKQCTTTGGSTDTATGDDDDDDDTSSSDAAPQTLILGVMGDNVDEAAVEKEVLSIFEAVAVEQLKGKSSFSDSYSLVVVTLQTPEDAQSVLASATEAAKSQATEGTLSSALSAAQTKIRESGVDKEALDPPMVAQAFLTCRQAYAKQAKTARAKVAAWKARISRGLIVDGNFGEQAEALLQKAMSSFDGETLSGAGLTLVSKYRLEMRLQLQSMVEIAVEELYELQVINLEKSTLKKLSRQLLSQQSNSLEPNVDANAAAVRNAAFAFESAMETLQIPSLGLTKDKAVQEMTGMLTDALDKFPDSPEAQLKRLKGVKKETSKEKKAGSRAVELGLDLVAMIRPDGFGSLQGFAGYQIGGNSVTVGVANDADDPQVIAQMGGVRPPLVRIQPKLRVDVEL
eukprot:CAMPEP_0119005948 /NCGR_PEP_ID=MMETSP1176-20130426/2024_1 /TAXON_ID=265551 /ORGANISM="Synedropsis recta cf, Strain CCMP1620" /LENGTH=532 /DNA_ID=CAMNT_0006957813 /DNA_START=69 /DNA_END=1667 /DNA_ORIENTATION=+